jgi:hypothetical protein
MKITHVHTLSWGTPLGLFVCALLLTQIPAKDAAEKATEVARVPGAADLATKPVRHALSTNHTDAKLPTATATRVSVRAAAEYGERSAWTTRANKPSVE